MKKIPTKVERYEYDDEFILEVWETKDPTGGLMWNFWLQHKDYSHKMQMFGWPADQTQAKNPKVYTKKEAIELAEANVEDYIDLYYEEANALEDYFEERMDEV